MSDGYLHVFQCPRWLADGGGPERHCGYIQGSPGVCPYDHGKPVDLVEVVAVVQCSDCGMPIPVDDGRAPDGRLICGECQIRYIPAAAGQGENDGGA
jgi:hypothetical protein